jgi:hypothetical protein
MLPHRVGVLRVSTGNADWGSSGKNIARGPLFVERGSLSAVPGGRRPGLPLAFPVLLA